MLIVSPDDPAVPAKRPSPPAAATTGAPAGAAMSMPRCCPGAYGSVTLRYGVMTLPATGQTQAAWAEGAGAKNAVRARKAMRSAKSRRIGRPYDRSDQPPPGRNSGVWVRYSDVSARYSAFALVPVREATTVAAFRGWAPASTSCCRAASAFGSGESDDGEAGGPTTSTTSPFGGLSE